MQFAVVSTLFIRRFPPGCTHNFAVSYFPQTVQALSVVENPNSSFEFHNRLVDIQIHMSLPYSLECPSPSIYSALANPGSSSLHLSFAGNGFEAVVCHPRKASRFPESFRIFGILDCYVFSVIVVEYFCYQNCIRN